jgi:hypothetical protein
MIMRFGLETAFTVVQWIMVGPLTAFAFAGAVRTEPAEQRAGT